MMINQYSYKTLAATLLLATLGTAYGEEFEIESAVIDSVSGQGLGVTREKGGISDFFKAQKTMMLGILSSSGIDFNSLPEGVRARLEKFQTTNLEAFKAFSHGLDLMDKGKYAEAHAYFEKATELDPNFKLAEEKKEAMPNVNLNNTLQLHTVIRDSSSTAVASGMSKVQVDLGQAIAAMQSGQTIVVGASTTPNISANNSSQTGSGTGSGSNSYTSNLPGSGAGYAPRKVVGISYDYTPSGASIGVASTNEWMVDQYTTNGNALETVGTGTSFVAQRGSATAASVGSATLTDGSAVYWGTWTSTPAASATVTFSGVQHTASSVPPLGSTVYYMMGDATRNMPTSGTVTFNPAGGFLNTVTGTVTVNFTTQQVNLNNLGFTLQTLNFSGLNGTANYGTGIAYGFYKGNFASGSCANCTAFSPTASAFTGNFVGASANGTIVSSIMQNGAGTVSGVHLFKQ